MEEKDKSHLGGGFIDWPDQCTMMPNIWQEMIDRHNVKSMADVGCGGGHCGKWFLDHGIDVIGIDGWQEAIDRNKLPKENLIQHDYNEGPLDIKEVDLVWSAEFVEHVDEKYVPNFMRTFRCGKHLLFTHAVPGQGGYHHVNERSERYWITMMESYGFGFDQRETMALRHMQPVIGGWGVQTLLYFKRI